MQTNKLKSYAPKARRDFIAAVTRRAAAFGLSAQGIEPSREEGQLVIIAGQAHPRAVGLQRQRLAERIRQQGFKQVMEAAAYTWFNRFAAIRFMELHGYLDHSFRVLSHPAAQGSSGFLPEILEQAQHVELPGLDRERVIALKMDGTQDEALYRDLLLAQCRALHQAMPFLFEPLDDETELLLPDRLLQTDSLIRELVTAIPEEDWQAIEIIGWLYQFYIAEKKDQVIGKVVKSEDIPAATQLFTPNWIVKYLVQNSLGAQWLATYPDSPLKGQMAYYIEPAEQTPEVQIQLASITPKSLNPEELTLMDPACGSGHILVEAYDLFKAIYLERGYRLREIPRLILEKNLFGLDIDGRAAQLAGFSLTMKAREDDRRLFERGVKLNVLALVDSEGFDAERLAQGVNLADYGLQLGDLMHLKRLFEQATTFGSLIQVPEGLAKRLPSLKQLSELTSTDLFIWEALNIFGSYVRQAEMLATQYHAVVANPPYMGNKYYCSPLKDLVNTAFNPGKADLYGAFTIRNMVLVKEHGRIGMITIPNWMFLSAFEVLRKAIFSSAPITSMVHNGRGVWGSDFGSSAFTLHKSAPTEFAANFMRLFDKQGSVASNDELVVRFHRREPIVARNADFVAIPGSPVAYWVSERVRRIYNQAQLLKSIAMPRQGIKTGNNERFLRQWWEVSTGNSATVLERNGETKWFPCTKGGAFRRWYGNHEYVLNWEDDGWEVKNFKDEDGRLRSRPQNTGLFFRSGITWSTVSIAALSMRIFPSSFVFESKGSVCFPYDSDDLHFLLALLNSTVVAYLLAATSPSVDFSEGAIGALPVRRIPPNRLLAGRLIQIACIDWDSYETSWDFRSPPIVKASSEATPTLESSFTAWIAQNRANIAEMNRLEEENNRLFIAAYGLQDELTPEVPIEQITLTVNPAYRYGGKLSEEEQWTRFRQDTMQELVSYAIGCAMGRYSLDEPGLIYAHSSNVGFDPSRYATFPADADGIIPITEADWFDDDASHRVVEFIAVAWDKAHLEENLQFLADNLSPKRGESSRDTLRRYLVDKFFKDHLQTYKRRPIYWCFSSGKQKAFQCLVYLHRYHEGTLSRMRMEYLVPLQSKLAARIDNLAEDIQSASTSAQAKRMQKERDMLSKQLDELRRYDEQLRHYADRRIALDLDDGVKVNYGKFGDLLAEVKTVTGTSAD